MADTRLLDWTDFGRGLVTLAKKAPALLRSAATLGLTRETSPMSLATLIEERARKHGFRAAVKSADGDLTYAQLNARANRTARLLIHQGVTPGQAVAVIMTNRPELLVSVLACAKVGAVASMINVNQRRQALTHSLACAPPATVIVGEEVLPGYLDVALSCPLLVVADPAMDAGTGRRPEGAVDVLTARTAFPSTDPPTSRQVAFGDNLFYIFTSGTTGLPKASVMSHRRWVGAGHLFGAVCMELTPSDTLYCPLPLYHNQALTTCWSSVVNASAALAIRRSFSASAFWEDCRRHEATAIAYIGEVARYLLAQPPSPVDRAHSVTRAIGLGMRAELWDPFKERFGLEHIYEFYGASELNMGFVNLMNLDRTVGVCPGSWALVAFDVDSGEPRRDSRGRLVRLTEAGDVGLLVTEVTDRFKFEGYTDEQATEKKLFRGAFSAGDCWINTGDLMRNIGFGHLQFVDRVGDTFRWKGENVATGEVEAALSGIDAVQACTVYGVEVPGRSGRAGMAAVVWDGEAGSAAADAIGEVLGSELPAYAVPVFLRFVSGLATTGTFKIKKTELKRQGFEPAGAEAGSLFVKLSQGYMPLDEALYARVVAGEERL